MVDAFLCRLHGDLVPTGEAAFAVDVVLLGRRFRERREALGRTQEDVAQESGITRNQLQIIELGLSDRASRRPLNPRLANLAAICQELGIRLTIDSHHPNGFVLEFDPPRPEGAHMRLR